MNKKPLIALPPQWARFEQTALKLINNHQIKEIEFSGPTYQVSVGDTESNQDYWTFLQFDTRNEIKDAFCSCESEEESSGCAHLAAAYLVLFDDRDSPMHVRFVNSFWNVLCQLYEERLGSDPSILKQTQPDTYVCYSSMGKILFSVHMKGVAEKKLFEQVFKDLNEETENTSIKFSNISQDELESWREGKPSPSFRYELSFWSDLAKALMKLQDSGEKYRIAFRSSHGGLPNWIEIVFDSLEVGFYISEANFPQIIPALKTVDSPLQVFDFNEKQNIHIHYDKKEGKLFLSSLSKNEHLLSEKLLKGGIEIKGWLYQPEKGFYALEPHEILQKPVVEGEDLSKLLSQHTQFIATHLKECQVLPEPIPVSYQLSFDSQWNLKIESYLFELHDLQYGASRFIGESWAYLDDDGFYRIEGKRFPESIYSVSREEIGDFISKNRTWFNGQEGFHTHFRSIELEITYEVGESGRLSFTKLLEKSREGNTMQEFGPWVYVEGRGFYSKSAGAFSHLLKAGVSLAPEQVPIFIRMNREELSIIPSFFSTQNPLKSYGLKVELQDKQTIVVSPTYECNDPAQQKNIRFYEEFIFTHSTGFFELPLKMRIPDDLQEEIKYSSKEDIEFFFEFQLQSIRPLILEFDPRLEKALDEKLVVSSIEACPEKGNGWYCCSLLYQTKLGDVPISSFKQAMQKKQSYLFSKAGRFDLDEDKYEWIHHLAKERLEKNSIYLTALEFMRLNAFDPVILQSGELSQETLSCFDKLTKMESVGEPDLSGLKSQLRPYQKAGVNWLWFLYSQQLSGLLCDDMGLGKTHQTMALLASVENFFKSHAEGTPFHFLIVCPTSVIYHWEDKLKEFLPSLRVSTFYGSERTLDSFHEQYDILLTSYGILRNEREKLSKIVFEIAIFDEVQVAKNQMSLVYTSLKMIQAHMKLGLTGTPIENHLRELKTLFDIVLPTYMPGEKQFREFFIKPIEKDQDSKKKELLTRLIKPFTMRRKKEEVLTDLPEKIEEISHCELSHKQIELYMDVLENKRARLISDLDDESSPVPYMHIFSVLSSLKQICDHPAVFLKSPHDYQLYPSGKWNLFVELLREARESQQKVVVFSQYLSMLDIIELFLTEEKIGFSSLRGSTTNRREQIERFNQDPTCEVFVGSLQAVGLGIDLTAGSVVIHYDRWWNAARENQATDRVHRIGQTRGVQVFKLVTKGTFEERIAEMILRKGRLMEEVVTTDDQSDMKKFSREELRNLLSFVNPNQQFDQYQLPPLDK